MSTSAEALSRQVTARYLVLMVLAITASVVTVLAGLPRMSVLAATAVVWLLLGVSTHTWPTIDIGVGVSAERIVEGDRVNVEVTAASQARVDWLEMTIETPSDLSPVDGIDRAVISLRPGEQMGVRFPMEAPRWGVASPQRLRCTVRDRFGLYVSRRVISLDLPVRIHPSDRSIDVMIASTRTRARVGNHRAIQRGDGCEYADLRPWTPGDRWRDINWRVSQRRNAPWVSDRHPDRASDIILLIDSGQGLGKGADSTLHVAVRAAIALTDGHLGAHDRVGLLDAGRQIRWYRPRMGRLQQRMLLDALLDTQAELGLGARRAADLPLGSIDSEATIIALTPLLDPAPVSLVLDIAAHGHDVALLWCQPDVDRIRQPLGITAQLARRLWDLERDLWRRRIDQAGIPVASWDGEDPLGTIVGLLDRRRTISRAGGS
ncbi:MAG: DUF58 domain-containing protein [Acidimicrobiales bacterium]